MNQFGYAIAHLISRSLKEFAERTYSYPATSEFSTIEKWQEGLLAITKDLDAHLNYDYSKDFKYEIRLAKKAHKAIKEFARIWPDLWM